MNVIRVLHVDDDSAMLEVSKQILMDLEGCFEFDSACCVDEALKKLAVEQYDVVISDYDMPGTNGLQFLEALREQSNDIPFILFTGKGREEIAIKALNLGADAYINKQGNPETVYGELSHSVQKTTERKRAKKLLAKNQDRLRRAQAIARVGNWELDLRTQKMWASEEAFKIYGFEQTDDSLPLKLVQQVALPEFRPILNSALQDLIMNNKEYNLEFKIKRYNDGQERFIHSQAELVYDDDKTPIMVNGVIQDVTERKRVEEALIVSEKNYRNLINGMGESAWVVDFEGNFVEVNDAAVEMLGYSREELLSLGIKGIDTYLDPEQVKNLMSHVVSGKNQVFETVHTSKDGTKIPVEISSSLITYQEKRAILAIARNITQRKKLMIH